ncbi:DEKNAAC100716 [Brettanomyces naardenensis]|uniref:DEKNAAC100716 n=1 Tax=Brettanomyces naardenensis TaxID=13370 RepID=A0A448YGI9_BRENA|nr:DEKNAAC100716 [Brettanomyces naardenensis]
MTDQRHVLFEELWQRDTIPFDDIELPQGSYSVSADARDNLLQQFLSNSEEPDSDLTIINGNNPMFNSSYANRLKQKARNLNWKDLGLSELLSKSDHIPDRTILQRPRFGDVRALEEGSLDSSEDDRAVDAMGPPQNIEAQSSFDTSSNANNDDEFAAGNATFESTAGLSVNRRIQQQGPMMTPVVNNRTISQNLETMNSFSSHLKRHHSGVEHGGGRVASIGNRSVSDDYENSESTHARLIR